MNIVDYDHHVQATNLIDVRPVGVDLGSTQTELVEITGTCLDLYFNGKCYHFVTATGWEHLQGEGWCKSKGGILASIPDQETNDFLKEKDVKGHFGNG